MMISRTLKIPFHDEKQRAWLDKHMAACGEFVAIEYLNWLSAHKRMENDVGRMTVLKRDYAETLSSYPEYSIALAVLWFIEENKSPWWPVLDEFKQVAEGYVVSSSANNEDTNMTALAKERFGEAVATAWFSQTILHERTLYGASTFVCGWIRNNYLKYLEDIVDEVKVLEIENEKK